MSKASSSAKSRRNPPPDPQNQIQRLGQSGPGTLDDEDWDEKRGEEEEEEEEQPTSGLAAPDFLVAAVAEIASFVHNPLIQVTRASYSNEASREAGIASLKATKAALPPPSASHPAPAAVQHPTISEATATPARATEGDHKEETRDDEEGAPRTSQTRLVGSSTSLVIEHLHHAHHHQSVRSTTPGTIVLTIGLVLFGIGWIMVLLTFVLFGITLVIFSGMLLICSSIYLVHCWLERFMTRRQKNFRQLALHGGLAYLTRPSRMSDRKSSGGGGAPSPPAPRRSSGDISNASEERVEAISDLASSGNEALLPARESNGKNVTKATVATPKTAKL